ncbi:larval/pupal cuticle protein H1C-like [Pieris brassicae]|uniref:larval/pupal cuticle protein H1C-like n=1 Tax=Pieris brassicae TaxID=7116 RepID=UPI001E65E89B|nr:larval/pupal cuticle protein H1C-like [Pieris brassicae]
MYKLIVFTAFLAVAAAAPGLYGAPLASPWGHGIGVAPVVSAPIVRTAVPVATSYANTVRIAGPALAVAHAPVVAAHGPILAAPLAHGW